MKDTALFDHGSFTLPGEAGHEALTLRLARQWGADAVRDSDGTELSPELLDAGHKIYSTVCLVRADNAWAKANPKRLQQNVLMSFPVVADGATLVVDLLKGFFREQFVVNFDDDPKRWWQVFDRTTGQEISRDAWTYDADAGTVTLSNTTPWHAYTVNFFVRRIWEEISMYNHITNDWGDREHVMAVDPIYPETRAHIRLWFRRWLEQHPDTDVVRFTSMFYNFTWFWGDDPKRPQVYMDWGDYAMTVSPESLQQFEAAKGYALTLEEFVNGGRYNCTHRTPSDRYRDYMDFLHDLVIKFGRECIALAHQFGKQAFVFYDDHWIGVEPYSERFAEFGFDGIIKCVFNAFEARKCAGVEGVQVRELRLHPYLFPTGLQGEPTFKEGGDPTVNAKEFWIDTRRALLRAPVDRIGLGGYLHLVEPYPDFCAYIESLAREFRLLKSLHEGDRPSVAPFKVAILTAWGKLRSWICSGHFTHGLPLNELLESLAGLPVEVEFISFEELLAQGVPEGVQVIINCGLAGSAWSGGRYWENPVVVERLTAFTAAGGGFIGIAEPSAVHRPGSFFQLAPVLGVDRDTGSRMGHAAYAWSPTVSHFITEDLESDADLGGNLDGIFVLGPTTQVLASRDGSPTITAHPFGLGRTVYLAGFTVSPANTRLIHRAIAWAAGYEDGFRTWTCSNPHTECAYYPATRRLVVINNSGDAQSTEVYDQALQPRPVSIPPYGIEVLNL